MLPAFHITEWGSPGWYIYTMVGRNNQLPIGQSARTLPRVWMRKAVFATGQSVRPKPGRGRTAVCRPVRSFSKVARHVKIKDEDGRHSVAPSGLF